MQILYGSTIRSTALFKLFCRLKQMNGMTPENSRLAPRQSRNTFSSMKRFLTICELLAVAVLVSSCAGVGFESAWNHALEDYQAGDAAEDVIGPWTGTWISEDNGHTGDLRCLASKDAGSDELHRFRYHATWGQFFRGGFNAKFPVQPDGNGYSVKGTQSLGLFGDFNHDGRIDGDAFRAKFGSAKGDYGVFEMNRPESE
jgi:hypothetical protein